MQSKILRLLILFITGATHLFSGYDDAYLNAKDDLAFAFLEDDPLLEIECYEKIIWAAGDCARVSADIKSKESWTQEVSIARDAVARIELTLKGASVLDKVAMIASVAHHNLVILEMQDLVRVPPFFSFISAAVRRHENRLFGDKLPDWLRVVLVDPISKEDEDVVMKAIKVFVEDKVEAIGEKRRASSVGVGEPKAKRTDPEPVSDAWRGRLRPPNPKKYSRW